MNGPATATIQAAANRNNNNNNLTQQQPPAEKKWIRGVNIGGWIVLERYITPYQVSESSAKS